MFASFKLTSVELAIKPASKKHCAVCSGGIENCSPCNYERVAIERKSALTISQSRCKRSPTHARGDVIASRVIACKKESRGNEMPAVAGRELVSHAKLIIQIWRKAFVIRRLTNALVLELHSIPLITRARLVYRSGMFSSVLRDQPRFHADLLPIDHRAIANQNPQAINSAIRNASRKSGELAQ